MLVEKESEFNDFDYTFRHGEGVVTAVKDGKTDELSIPADAQDAMSCLYYVRKVLPICAGGVSVYGGAPRQQEL